MGWWLPAMAFGAAVVVGLVVLLSSMSTPQSYTESGKKRRRRTTVEENGGAGDESQYDSNSQGSAEVERLCAVCFTLPRCAALIPCGHVQMCLNCANRVQRATGVCPICRQGIKDILNVYI